MEIRIKDFAQAISLYNFLEWAITEHKWCILSASYNELPSKQSPPEPNEFRPACKKLVECMSYLYMMTPRGNVFYIQPENDADGKRFISSITQLKMQEPEYSEYFPEPYNLFGGEIHDMLTKKEQEIQEGKN